MKPINAVMRRELRSYFVTPVAYVFLVIFLVLAGILTFYVGDFYERGQADLQPFFVMQPWLYLILVPAITMRMWAEEAKGGTLELLLTLPLTLWQAMLGKFLAAWLFIGLALVLTLPIWITVNYLGSPDNGVILAGYLGSWLMAGTFIAIGACLSAVTRSQVVAFILTALVCVLLILAAADVGFFSRHAAPATDQGGDGSQHAPSLRGDCARCAGPARPGVFPAQHGRLAAGGRAVARPQADTLTTCPACACLPSFTRRCISVDAPCCMAR
jgi:ABC-2 type transport system permease protein